MKKSVKILLALFLSLAIVTSPNGVTKAAGFQDVSGFKKEIDYLTQMGVIGGFSDGTFRPATKLTRAQAVVMVMRARGMSETDITSKDPGFNDVEEKDFGYKEIAYAARAGFISGKSKRQFDPAGNITRAEMAKVLGKAFKLTGTYEPGFNDVSSSYWAFPSISSLAASNITVGYNDGTFRPSQPIDRAQFSAFLARIMKPHFRPSVGIPTHSVLEMPIESTIIDLEKHPTKPIVYYINGETKTLVKLNLETKTKKTVEFKHPAERLVIKNEKVFVTQLIQTRSPYNFMETQKGIVNVYNADDLTLLNEVQVNIDPFDIAVDETETLVISSGSDQGINSEIHTYNWKTSEQLSSANLFPQQNIELSPQNKIYSVASNHYTGKMEIFSVQNGIIEKEPMPSRFFDTSGLRGYAKIAADGKAIYNGNGTVFALNDNPSDDLAPLGKLATPFTTMAFDGSRNTMYLADREELISVYKTNTLDPISTLHTYGNIQHLFYVPETKELYAITNYVNKGSQKETMLVEAFNLVN